MLADAPSPPKKTTQHKHITTTATHQLEMGKGKKIVHKKAPKEGFEDLFATEALNVDESSSSSNEVEDDSNHEPTQAIASKRSAVDVEDDDDATQITQDKNTKELPHYRWESWGGRGEVVSAARVAI